jgi:hypothetical protein
MIQASYKGLFFIKELEQASIDAGITKLQDHIYCNAKDGGNAPEDDVPSPSRYDQIKRDPRIASRVP